MLLLNAPAPTTRPQTHHRSGSVALRRAAAREITGWVVPHAWHSCHATPHATRHRCAGGYSTPHRRAGLAGHGTSTTRSSPWRWRHDRPARQLLPGRTARLSPVSVRTGSNCFTAPHRGLPLHSTRLSATLIHPASAPGLQALLSCIRWSATRNRSGRAED